MAFPDGTRHGTGNDDADIVVVPVGPRIVLPAAIGPRKARRPILKAIIHVFPRLAWPGFPQRIVAVLSARNPIVRTVPAGSLTQDRLHHVHGAAMVRTPGIHLLHPPAK